MLRYHPRTTLLILLFTIPILADAMKPPDAVNTFFDATSRIDADLAVAWTPNDLYLNGEFHHCGVNSFNLIRTDDDWKIAGVSYSMETESCDDSTLGPPDCS